MLTLLMLSRNDPSRQRASARHLNKFAFSPRPLFLLHQLTIFPLSQISHPFTTRVLKQPYELQKLLSMHVFIPFSCLPSVRNPLTLACFVNRSAATMAHASPSSVRLFSEPSPRPFSH
jgi:hypothetical protein